MPVGKVVRPTPEAPWFMSVYLIGAVFGFIQFMGMYAEFTYVVDSIFKSHAYAMFGFLLVNFML